jgi:tetratricopeptide (TPR) repeat protein
VGEPVIIGRGFAYHFAAGFFRPCPLAGEFDVFRAFHFGFAWCWVLLLALAGPSLAENEGLDDLDKATQLKVTAQNLQDLNGVVDHLDTALEKGLDKDNAEFAQQLLLSTLLQRGSMYSGAVFNVSRQAPQPDRQILLFRQSALNDLQRVVASDPKQWDAQLLIGRLQSLRFGTTHFGDTEAAKKALSAVADADEARPEQRAEALALRSELHRKPEQKLEDLNRAVELQPEMPEFLHRRAEYYRDEKKYGEALTDADHALKLDPKEPEANELRGMILLDLERYDDALESFNKASELAPGETRPYQFRAQLFRQKGDLDKAAEQLTKALELAPDNVGLLLVRAGIYYELKKSDLALADIEQAIRVQPDLVEPYRMRAEILAATDHIDQAIAELGRLIPQVPADRQADLASRLGTFYMIANQPHKAIEALSKAVEKNPEDEDAFRLRADAYLSTGQHAEAINDFEHVFPHAEKDTSLLNNFAWVLATSPEDKLRDGARAVTMATEACELTGYETPHILSTLAAAYAESGDFENAKKWSAKAVELSQKGVDAATTDEERKRLEADHVQLKKELASYEEGKPTRERQSVEDAKLPSTTTDRDATPSAPPAPARTVDF